MTHYPIPPFRPKPGGLLILMMSASLAFAGCAPQPTPGLTVTLPPTDTPTPTLSPTPAPTQTPYVITATGGDLDPSPVPAPQGTFILSLADSGYDHLFAFRPQTLSLTRLTGGSWNDITPALSPDGTRVAFASDHNGYWDLYLLDLTTGLITRLTDTPAYDAAPSWSPDGAWVAYESYFNGSSQVFIHSVKNPAQVPIPLTKGASSNFSPAWSPRGRQIAFVSDRSGENEIWVADLDKLEDQRFADVSQDNGIEEAHPSWSVDGTQLAWSANDPDSGLPGIYVWNAQTPTIPARWVGSGDWPVWEDGLHIAARLASPNQTFLTGYAVPHGEMALPPVLLPSPLSGISYGNTSLPFPGPFREAAAQTPPAVYVPALSPPPNVPSGRAWVVELAGVQAPYPQLHDLVDESFQALRLKVSAEVGWDALGTLDNAYVPLTTPSDPGLGEDWLYTGRAFAMNSSLLSAGWMVVVREDFGQQTYWRVYLRTRAQDGSQGQPLRQIPWDLSARSGDPQAYDQGGRLMASIPAGYYFDLTALAIQYGWERLPALSNWRMYYNGARFNEFAMTQGEDWRTAMLELYPPEVLVTPTVIRPPTRTPTRTPRWYRTPTSTRTPTFQPTTNP